MGLFIDFCRWYHDVIEETVIFHDEILEITPGFITTKSKEIFYFHQEFKSDYPDFDEEFIGLNIVIYHKNKIIYGIRIFGTGLLYATSKLSPTTYGYAI